MQVDKVTGIIFGIAGIYVAIAFVAASLLSGHWPWEDSPGQVSCHDGIKRLSLEGLEIVEWGSGFCAVAEHGKPATYIFYED